MLKRPWIISGLFRIVSLNTSRFPSLYSFVQLKSQPFLMLIFFKSDLASGWTSVGKLSPEIVFCMLFVSLSISIPKWYFTCFATFQRYGKSLENPNFKSFDLQIINHRIRREIRYKKNIFLAVATATRSIYEKLMVVTFKYFASVFINVQHFLSNLFHKNRLQVIVHIIYTQSAFNNREAIYI